MNDLLSKFSYSATPKAPSNSVKDEEGADPLKAEDKNAAVVQATFADITADIQLLSENKRNCLSADQLFCLYLRDCSQLVNDGYYKQIV